MSRYINFRVVAAAVVVALGLLCITMFALWILRPNSSASPPGTAVVNVIPYQSPTPLPATPTIPATETVDGEGTLPSPPSGDIAIGAYVQVSGTGGDGLRMRSEPGLAGEIKFLGLEAEVFLVQEGPEQVDGYTWWFLVAPYDETVQGWAVANYLQTVQNP